jgi:hypothetical protein
MEFRYQLSVRRDALLEQIVPRPPKVKHKECNQTKRPGQHSAQDQS